MSKFRYSNALLIIEGSYLSSIVSAHTSAKVSTSASYNYELATDLFARKCGVGQYSAVTFCDALPFDDHSDIAETKIQRVRKFHNYLKRNGVKIKLGKTEKMSNEYRQTGVNTEIVDTMCYYHGKYNREIPLLIVSADKHLFSCAKRLINDGRPVIFIGSDDQEKRLYFKPSLKKLATDFVNLTTEDVLMFKDKPGFKKDV